MSACMFVSQFNVYVYSVVYHFYIYLLICSRVFAFVVSSLRSSVHALVRSFFYSFVCLLVHLFLYPCIDALVHSYLRVFAPSRLF